MMDKIIYSKYSDERDKRFQIRTDIIQNEFRKKIVRKQAITNEAERHVSSIYESYLLLSDLYKETNIRIPECIRKNKSVRIEYVEGKTLDEELDEIYIKQGIESFLEKIKEYCLLVKTNNIYNFEITPEFTSVFGNVNFSEPLSAANVNDIDLIFSNIIIGKEWNIIDYEWTFNFRIPTNFIIYRALKIYIEGSIQRNELKKINIFNAMNISEDEIIQYEKMEKNFQSYVKGKTVSLKDLYESIGKNRFRMTDYIYDKHQQLRQSSVKIYYDYGLGFNEKDTKIICLESKDEVRVIESIKLDKNLIGIRIDPSEQPCIVKINHIKYNNNIDYISNGIQINEKYIIFNNDDAQIVLNCNIKEIPYVDIDMCVYRMSHEIADIMLEYNRRINKKLKIFSLFNLKNKLKK